MTAATPFKNDIVRQLADILNDTHLTEIEYEVEGCRIRVARQVLPAPVNYANVATSPTTVIEMPAHASEDMAGKINIKVPLTPHDFANIAGAVKAAMVGTVYMAANPGAAPFITVGDRVSKGQTLFIIEAMKVMNQIKSPQDGVVKHIFTKDADPIEYGQVLVVLE